MNFNHLLSLDRRYTKTESEIFRLMRNMGFSQVSGDEVFLTESLISKKSLSVGHGRPTVSFIIRGDGFRAGKRTPHMVFLRNSSFSREKDLGFSVCRRAEAKLSVSDTDSLRRIRHDYRVAPRHGSLQVHDAAVRAASVSGCSSAVPIQVPHAGSRPRALRG